MCNELFMRVWKYCKTKKKNHLLWLNTPAGLDRRCHHLWECILRTGNLQTTTASTTTTSMHILMPNNRSCDVIPLLLRSNKRARNVRTRNQTPRDASRRLILRHPTRARVGYLKTLQCRRKKMKILHCCCRCCCDGVMKILLHWGVIEPPTRRKVVIQGSPTIMEALRWREMMSGRGWLANQYKDAPWLKEEEF